MAASCMKIRKRNSPSASSDTSQGSCRSRCSRSSPLSFGIGYLPAHYQENILEQSDSDCSGKFTEFPEMYHGKCTTRELRLFMRGVHAGYQTARFSTTSTDTEIDTEVESINNYMNSEQVSPQPGPSSQIKSRNLPNAVVINCAGMTSSDSSFDGELGRDNRRNYIQIQQLQPIRRNSTTGEITYESQPVELSDLSADGFGVYETEPNIENEQVQENEEEVEEEEEAPPSWLEDKGNDADTESDRDDTEDPEIPWEDRWPCSNCFHKNHPMTRRCMKCWVANQFSSLKRSASSPPLFSHECKRTFSPSSTVTSRDNTFSGSISHPDRNDSGVDTMSSQETIINATNFETSDEHQNIHASSQTSSNVILEPQNNILSSVPTNEHQNEYLQTNNRFSISNVNSQGGIINDRSSNTESNSDTRSHETLSMNQATGEMNNYSKDLSKSKVSDTLQAFRNPDLLGKTDNLQEKCCICMEGNRNASFIHGDTGHQVCCYDCAIKLKSMGRKCPVCRRKVDHVIVNYL